MGSFSDQMAKRFGIRGRLWGLWVVQTVAGLMCILLGRLDSLRVSIAVMCIFSILVQASSGLVCGIVPFVSKRYDLVRIVRTLLYVDLSQFCTFLQDQSLDFSFDKHVEREKVIFN